MTLAAPKFQEEYSAKIPALALLSNPGLDLPASGAGASDAWWQAG